MIAESEGFETQLLKKKTHIHGKRKAVSKASKTRKWSDDVLDELIDMLGRKDLHLMDVFSSVEEITTNETEEKRENSVFKEYLFKSFHSGGR